MSQLGVIFDGISALGVIFDGISALGVIFDGIPSWVLFLMAFRVEC